MTMFARFVVWMSLKLGTMDIKSLCEALEKEFKLGVCIKKFLMSPEFVISRTEVELDIVKIKVRDLGFTENFTPRGLVYKLAFAQGLSLCPIEVAPQLCLQTHNWQQGDLVEVAANPFQLECSTDVHLFWLIANQNGKLELNCESGRDDFVLSLDNVIVFSCPRKK